MVGAESPCRSRSDRHGLGEAVVFLAEQPGIGAKYEGTRAPGVRRLFLGRVGYFIYYKAGNGTLHVLALWHASREHQPVL